MAEKEYIEREAALKILENSLTFCKRELFKGSFRQGCIAATQDDIGNIKHIPTADVAPRAEVAREIFKEIEEALQYEIDLEDKHGRNAWEQGDISAFQTHEYAEDKLETILIALSLFKKKYTEGQK